MAEVGRVSGTVEMRPARAGLIINPAIDHVVSAVECATRSWGGAFSPIFDASHPRPLKLAQNLQIDFFHNLANPDAHWSSEARGFRWTQTRGLEPFSGGDSSFHSRLLGSDWNLDTSSASYTLPSWSDDDPLAALYAVWFGKFADLDMPEAVAFKQVAKPIEITTQAIASALFSVTPIVHTTSKLHYRGDERATGIVLVDPGNVADLISFWNLRAQGAAVLPWVLGYEDQFSGLLSSWISLESVRERLHRWHGSNGKRIAAAQIWRRAEFDEASVDKLLQSLALMDIKPLPEGSSWILQRRHMDHIDADVSRSFDVETTSNPAPIIVPLPLLPWRHGQRLGRWPGIVAVEVSIYDQGGIDPDFTYTFPRLRDANRLYAGMITSMAAFLWSTGGGYVVGVHAAEESIEVPVFTTFDVAEELLDIPHDEHAVQSDEGRFATRLSGILGGRYTALASQPAVRDILVRAASTDNGITLDELEQRAISSRGSWPDKLARHSTDAKRYARSLIFELLGRKLLRCVLPIICPRCKSQGSFNPDQLKLDIECTFCSHQFPIGLALALAGPKSNWRYAAAGHAPRTRLEGALPVIASGSVLELIGHGGVGRGGVTQAWGLKVKHPIVVEIDIFAIVDQYVPIVVIGEVKSRHKIDEKDVAGLVAVQALLRSRGIECFLLFATLREQFEQDEIHSLRMKCEEGLRLIHNDSLATPLALPIVLTQVELSVDRFDDAHPWSWLGPGRSISEVAIESCKRHLGLVDATVERLGDGGENTVLTWRDAGASEGASGDGGEGTVGG